jgi:hypothetical protein
MFTEHDGFVNRKFLQTVNSSLISQRTVKQSFVVFYRVLLNYTFSVIYFFVNNDLIQSPPFSVSVLYTIAAHRRVLDNYGALLCVEVGQPCCRI